MSIHDTRIREFPNAGNKLIMEVAEPALSIISVAVQEVEAPVVLGPELGVPEPISVKPTLLGAVRIEVHVHVPEGMLIVSPFTTVCVGPLMTALTSE
jgi:hypothetical protein